MDEEYPEENSPDLEKHLEIYEQLDEVLECLLGYAEQFRELGYNIGIMIHTYDPLMKEASYIGEVIGDQYAVKGCLREWLDNG